MIDKLFKTWNIKHAEGDEFTGYESVYDQLDVFDKHSMIEILKAQLKRYTAYIAVSI